jgi:lipopolysaccharide transport system ATP-binding protein
MSDTVIKVDKISKKYSIGAFASGSLRESLVDKWHKLFRYNNNDSNTFWALKDISFEVKKGDILGIIGKNGAGKSTLLKILSKITEPTSGRAEITGIVSSLLEVGTGFHPELTGRENIFLNGTILGMTRREVRTKFDEIVDFSGIEKFIDTPVKHYSSGMYVRLAFAVAAHLEPEILIIDEVLAVGDAEFQKKCLGKMKDVAGQGRTILFVSHNMSAISSLCDKALLLNQGSIISKGICDEVINHYYSLNKYTKILDQGNTLKNEVVRLLSVKIINSLNKETEIINIGEKSGVEIKYQILKEGFSPRLSLHLFSSGGETIFCSIDNSECDFFIGCYSKIVWFPDNFFNDNEYSIGIAMSTFAPHTLHFFERDLIMFNAIDDFSSFNRQGYTGNIAGMIRPRLKWENIII